MEALLDARRVEHLQLLELPEDDVEASVLHDAGRVEARKNGLEALEEMKRIIQGCLYREKLLSHN